MKKSWHGGGNKEEVIDRPPPGVKRLLEHSTTEVSGRAAKSPLFVTRDRLDIIVAEKKQPAEIVKFSDYC